MSLHLNTMLLLLHGALGSKSQLDSIKTALANQGNTVVAMNFSGHSGEPFSEKGFGIEVFADDVDQFLADRWSQEPVNIFGYSMGGYVALWYAYQYPHKVGKIITLGTKFDWDPASAQREVGKLDPDKIIEKVPAFARILEHRHAPNDWREVISRTSEMMLQLGNQPLLTEDVLASINHDVEIWLGDRDDMADFAYSQRVAAILPRGRFRLLSDTPHPVEKLRDIPFGYKPA